MQKRCTLLLALLLAAACSTQVEQSTGGSVGSAGSGAGSTSSTGSGGQGGGIHLPPDPPPQTPPDGMGVTSFVVSRLFMGSTTRQGVPDPNAWKQYGYDIDGKLGAVDSCKPMSNLPPAVQADGVDGTDNSFGNNMMPVLLGLVPGYETEMNQHIAAGDTSTLFTLVELGSGATYNPMAALAYTGAATDSPPKLDGTDTWPVTAESLSDPADISSASVATSQSYMTGNMWVALFKGVLTVKLQSDSLALPIRIHDPVVTMQLDDAHLTATNGTIAGVLWVDELEQDVMKAAIAFDPSLCSSAGPQSVAIQLASAADVMKDGKQDPSQKCDGISIGLGFDAERVVLAIAPPEPPPPNPCSMP